MDFKSLLSQLDQLNEATDRSEPGKVKHSAEPGGYGRKDDEDEEGNKVKDTSTEKRGKGRPKKDADASGETKKYDFSAFGVKSGKDVKLPKYDKKKSTIVKGKSQSHASNKVDDGTDPGEEPKTNKKGLKEYFDSLNKALLEAEQIEIKPASQVPQKPGQPAQAGQQQQVAGQAQKNTQVITQGNRTLGTVNNPALAAQIKKELEGGGMTLMPEGEMDEGRLDELGNTDAGRKALRAVQKRGGDEITAWNKKPESGYSPTPTKAAKHFDASVSAGNRLYGHGPNTLRKDTVLARDAMRRYHKGEPITPEEVKIISKWYPGFKVEQQGKMDEGFGDIAKKVGGAMKTAGAKVLDTLGHGSDEDLIKQMQKRAGLPQTGKKPEQQNKIKEAERPTLDSTMGAGLGAGRSQSTFEAKKPDANKNGIPDYAEDGKGKNDLKKKKVKEGMDHKLQAARLEGKSHGLRKENYNCRFDDMEESRMYHEGYKEGLDECYGQGGLGKVMGETDALPATVPGMASAAETAMEDDMYEMDKSEWMSHKAKSTPGNTFKAFGQTFKDKEVVESPFAFEAWDNQLNSLLESNEQVNEGMTVSITKGQQGAPDSVSINAQDAEADKLLAFVKQAGLGIFGGDEAQTSAYGAPMSADAEGGSNVGGISVVDDHDGMMNLMKKLSGMGGEAGPQDSHDYEEEGSAEEHSHEHGEEETCNECGMAYEACGGNHGDKEMVEDDGDYDADEIGGPDDESGEEYIDQAEEEVAEAEEVVNNDDEANEENSDAVRDAALAQAADDNEKQVDEGEYANSDDDTFAADIDFMTNIISGGLNKKKSTGQTTIPVIAGQEERMTANESIVADWIKLAGIK